MSEIIGPRIGPSVFLLTYGMLISLLVAVPLGVLSALHRNRPADHGIRVFATFGLAMPAFWFGLLLVEVFSLHLHLLPVAGYGIGLRRPPREPDAAGDHRRRLPGAARHPHAAVEPDRDAAARLRHGGAGARASARSASIGKHALRNALIATVTILAINIGYLISGSVVIENVFKIPGLGIAARLVDPDARLPDDLGADADLRRARDPRQPRSPTSPTRSIDPRIRL